MNSIPFSGLLPPLSYAVNHFTSWYQRVCFAEGRAVQEFKKQKQKNTPSLSPSLQSGRIFPDTPSHVDLDTNLWNLDGACRCVLDWEPSSSSPSVSLSSLSSCFHHKEDNSESSPLIQTNTIDRFRPLHVNHLTPPAPTLFQITSCPCLWRQHLHSCDQTLVFDLWGRKRITV